MGYESISDRIAKPAWLGYQDNFSGLTGVMKVTSSQSGVENSHEEQEKHSRDEKTSRIDAVKSRGLPSFYFKQLTTYGQKYLRESVI